MSSTVDKEAVTSAPSEVQEAGAAATRLLGQLATLLRVGLVGVAGAYFVLYLAVVLLRIGYPFDLEWMEGGMVDHVRRILAGQPLYGPPSLEFTPYIYTPLYYYVGAALSEVVGVGFLSLRLVSFVASLGSFVIIFLLVRRETGSTLAGFVASALFAAAFRASGHWYDIARVDSLFLALLLAAVYVMRFGRSSRSALLAGTLITLAFLTKQIALVAIAPLLVYQFVSDRRSGALVAGMTALLVMGSTLVLDFLHGGWYRYYVFLLPTQHAISREMFVDFWSKDVFALLPIASILAPFYLLIRADAHDYWRSFFYGSLLAGALLTSWVSRLHVGGYYNVLMPAHAALAILFGLAVHEIWSIVRRGRSGQRRSWEAFSYAVIGLQFVFLVYNPLLQVPTEEDRRAGNELIVTVGALEGEVLILHHGYLGALAGKRTYAHEMAMQDVLRREGGAPRSKLIEETKHALASQRFSAIILDSNWHWAAIQDVIEEHYKGLPLLYTDRSTFSPRTGMLTRPDRIFRPKGSSPQGMTGADGSRGGAYLRQ